MGRRSCLRKWLLFLFQVLQKIKHHIIVTKEQAAEFIRLMKQAIFSADSQVDNFSEPIANAMNVMLGEIDPNQDLLLDCGNAEETSDNS